MADEILQISHVKACFLFVVGTKVCCSGSSSCLGIELNYHIKQEVYYFLATVKITLFVKYSLLGAFG